MQRSLRLTQWLQDVQVMWLENDPKSSPPGLTVGMRSSEVLLGLVCPKHVVPEALLFSQMQLCKPSCACSFLEKGAFSLQPFYINDTSSILLTVLLWPLVFKTHLNAPKQWTAQTCFLRRAHAYWWPVNQLHLISRTLLQLTVLIPGTVRVYLGFPTSCSYVLC